MSRQGKLVVISGPSGVGKTTVCERMLQFPGFERVVTCTTRPPRAREEDSKDYHFVSRQEFAADLKKGMFLEHATVHGNLYGTLREPVEEALRRGSYVLLAIDVNGAAQLRKLPELRQRMVSIFLAPPDELTLLNLQATRATERADGLAERLRTGEGEMHEKESYDHVVVNDQLDATVREILGLVGYEP